MSIVGTVLSGLNREVVSLGRLSIESICVLAAVVTFPIRDYVLFTASTPQLSQVKRLAGIVGCIYCLISVSMFTFTASVGLHCL